MANPLWEYADECCSIPSNVGDILITAVDPEQEPMALRTAYTGLPEQVIPASLRGCASCDAATEMSFAAPHAIYHEGHNLLDEVKEAVLDSGSTTTLTSSSQNCENCEPISVKIMLAKKHQTMEAKFKCTKAYYFRNRSGTLH